VPSSGVATVNVPVVTTAEYVFDASAPGGAFAPGETERLNGWFQGLGLGYGDSVYVDGGDASARRQVAQLAGRHGLLVQDGAPVTAGAIAPDAVRVVVSRRRAEVPGCPNWSRPSSPTYDNASMSTFGCAVNSNFAVMVADPVDLIHGREGNSTVDAATAAKAVNLYRSTAPTGSKGLEKVATKGGN
jgi:pilus assembly protein CpaD